MMHSHDLDLIAEHASGYLTGADETRAAQLVDSCETCRQEFDTHREIRSVLAAAAAPAMSEFERTKMRRSVLDSVAPTGSAVSPWQRRFLAVAGSVAALFVVVSGVGVLNNFGSDSGAVFTAADSTIASSEDIPAAEMDAASATMEAVGEEDQRVFEETAGDAYGQGGGHPWFIDATGVEDPEVLASFIDEMAAAVAEQPVEFSVADAEGFGALCGAVVDGPLLGVIFSDVDGVRVETFFSGDHTNPTITPYDTDTCTPLTD
jgi:anti-sigma factor RsiW